jgi:hypothetical protein
MKLDKIVLVAQKKKETQALVWSGFIIECLSVAYMIVVAFLFAEDFDPARRYVYNVIVFFAPDLKNSFSFNFVYLGAYALAVRFCLGYVIFVVEFLALIVQFSHYWKSVLFESCSGQSETEFPSTDLRKLFKTLYLLTKIVINSAWMQTILPIILAPIFVLVVFALAGAVKLFGSLDPGTYFLFPSAAIGFVVAPRYLWVSFADAQIMANKVLRQWQCKRARTVKQRQFVKYAKCCRPLVGVIGPFFELSRETLVLYYEQILDKVITLILY